MLEWLDHIGRLLADTPLSAMAHELLLHSIWLAPGLQSVHILSVAVIIGAAGAINLRLLGVVARDETPARLIRRLVPFVWGALVVMLLTGSVFILNRPHRYFDNWSFLTKVVLILVAIAFTLGMQQAARRNPSFGVVPGAASRTVAGLALLVWTGIIFAGRWIAYA